ncbi:hypothetical protein EVJ58_g1510 [Rhodofomes roseus]|uniref:Uncharacterized protein n=1 Tax=Rhodofomes roseus TaxID=34475 RepID=A0A4Y9YYD0_9APHY|nr:hypothetical protein EVJ58_g1510 [Rhodofomes roseus]
MEEHITLPVSNDSVERYVAVVVQIAMVLNHVDALSLTSSDDSKLEKEPVVPLLHVEVRETTATLVIKTAGTTGSDETASSEDENDDDLNEDDFEGWVARGPANKVVSGPKPSQSSVRKEPEPSSSKDKSNQTSTKVPKRKDSKAPDRSTKSTDKGRVRT